MRQCAACGAPIAGYNKSGFCSARPCRLAAGKAARMMKAEARERRAVEEILNGEHPYYLRRVRPSARPVARRRKQDPRG